MGQKNDLFFSVPLIFPNFSLVIIEWLLNNDFSLFLAYQNVKESRNPM